MSPGADTRPEGEMLTEPPSERSASAPCPCRGPRASCPACAPASHDTLRFGDIEIPVRLISYADTILDIPPSPAIALVPGTYEPDDGITRVYVEPDDAPALFETRAPGVCDRVLIGGVEFPPPAGRFNTLLAEAAKGILVTTFANMDRARMLDLLPYPRIEEHALDRWEGEGGAS